MPRPRDRVLANLESIYREAYDRAKSLGDERRTLDLDAAYQREQLLLEVLLDIRDSLAGLAAAAPPAHSAEPASSSIDPISAIETIRRVTKLR